MEKPDVDSTESINVETEMVRMSSRALWRPEREPWMGGLGHGKARDLSADGGSLCGAGVAGVTLGYWVEGVVRPWGPRAAPDPPPWEGALPLPEVRVTLC